MKRIIKKSLGLALAFVMVLTLAPVAANAAVSPEVDNSVVNSPVIDNSYVSGPSYGYPSGPSYTTGPSYEYVTTDEYVFVGVVGDYVAGESEDVVITSKDSIIAHAIAEAAAMGTPVKLATTSETVFMSFDAKELLAAGDFKLNLTVAVKSDVKDEVVAKNAKITKDNFVLKIEFNHDGKLPGVATVEIAIPEDIAEKYDVLYYYQIMEDGTLKFVCDAPVKDGVATVKQDHCSDYVLLTEKVAEDASPKTGDSSNIALWVAVLGLGVVAIAGSVVMKKRES